MAKESDESPHASGLPEDAERIGLTPLTAPGLRLAAALRAGRPRDKALAWIALAVILAVVVVAVLTAIWG